MFVKLIKDVNKNPAALAKALVMLGAAATLANSTACYVETQERRPVYEEEVVYEEVVYEDQYVYEEEVYYVEEPLSYGWCEASVDGFGYSIEMDGLDSDFFYTESCYGCVQTEMRMAFGLWPHHDVVAEMSLVEPASPYLLGTHDLGFGWGDPSPYVDHFFADVAIAPYSEVWEGMVSFDYMSDSRIEGEMELLLDNGWLRCGFDLGRNYSLDRWAY